MSLFVRKPRPLKRDTESLRDDRLFIIGTDDTYAPKQYFDFFQLSRVKIFVVPMEDNKSSAKHTLDRLLKYEHEADDELWMLLDTDHYTTGSHLKSFLEAITEARQKGINIAISKPCFDLWLLLHHVDETEVKDLEDCKAVAALFREKIGSFNKTNLKRESYPTKAIVKAYHRAKRLDKNVQGGDNPQTNTTRVWQLINSIIEKSLPSQLPKEFIQLRE